MSRSGGYLGGGTILYFSPYETGFDRSFRSDADPSGECQYRAKGKSSGQRQIRLVQIEREFVAAFARAQVTRSKFKVPKACKMSISKHATIMGWINVHDARRRHYQHCLRVEERRAGILEKPRTGRVLPRL